SSCCCPSPCWQSWEWPEARRALPSPGGGAGTRFSAGLWAGGNTWGGGTPPPFPAGGGGRRATLRLASRGTWGSGAAAYARLGWGRAGLDPAAGTTGSWVTAAEALGGRWLGLAVVAGGMASAMGMFNALVLSYSRLPMALAEDGFLPRSLALRTAAGVPWVSV